MNTPNVMSWLLSIALCASLISCAVKPPDVYAFKKLSQRLSVDEKGSLILAPSPTCMKEIKEFECGYGVSIVTGKEIFVGEKAPYLFNGKTWTAIQEESILLPAEESYAPLSTYIINACAEMNCGNEVDRFKIKLDALRKKE